MRVTMQEYERDSMMHDEPVTDDELDRIEEAIQFTGTLPWRRDFMTGVQLRDPFGQFVAQCAGEAAQQDAAFIEIASQMMPRLLAEVRQLRETRVVETTRNIGE